MFQSGPQHIVHFNRLFTLSVFILSGLHCIYITIYYNYIFTKFFFDLLKYYIDHLKYKKIKIIFILFFNAILFINSISLHPVGIVMDSQKHSMKIYNPRTVLIHPLEFPEKSQIEKTLLENVENIDLPRRWMEGQMLWGKVRGYPFWPCMVTKDPFYSLAARAIGMSILDELFI